MNHLPECGRTFQENSGSFTSPTYHAPSLDYEPEACEWRITATHGEKIVLNITDLVGLIVFLHLRFALLTFCWFKLGYFQIEQLPKRLFGNS